MNKPIDFQELFQTFKKRVQQEAQKRKPKNTANPGKYGFESEESVEEPIALDILNEAMVQRTEVV